MIGTESLFAFFAIDEWIGKRCQVTRGLPDFWILNHRGIDPHHVVALAHEHLPPGISNVVFEFRAIWPVIPGVRKSSVDFGVWIHKSASLTERDE